MYKKAHLQMILLCTIFLNCRGFERKVYGKTLTVSVPSWDKHELKKLISACFKIYLCMGMHIQMRF